MGIYLGSNNLLGGGGGKIPVGTYGHFFINTGETIQETNDGSVWLRTGNTLTNDGTQSTEDAGSYPYAAQAYTQSATGQNVMASNVSSAFSSSSNGGGMYLDRLNDELICVGQVATTTVNVKRFENGDDYTQLSNTGTVSINDSNTQHPATASDGTTLYKLVSGRDVSLTQKTSLNDINGNPVGGVIPATGTYPHTLGAVGDIIDFTGTFTAIDDRRVTVVFNGTYFWLGNTSVIQQFTLAGAFVRSFTTQGYVGSTNNTTFWCWDENRANGNTFVERNFDDGSLTGVSFQSPALETIQPSFSSACPTKDGVFVFFDFASGFAQRWDEYLSVIGDGTAKYTRVFGNSSGTILTGESYRTYVKIGDKS